MSNVNIKTDYFICIALLAFFLAGLFSFSLHASAYLETEAERIVDCSGSAGAHSQDITAEKNKQNQGHSLMLCCADQQDHFLSIISERSKKQAFSSGGKNLHFSDPSLNLNSFANVISTNNSPPQKESLASIRKKE